jgi:hypothetical protein
LKNSVRGGLQGKGDEEEGKGHSKVDFSKPLVEEEKGVEEVEAMNEGLETLCLLLYAVTT